MQGKRTLAGQGEAKQASITDFKIDKEGPIIEIILTYPDGSVYHGGWTNQLLNYSISASDLVCDSLIPGTINLGGTVLGGLNADGSAVSGTLVFPVSSGGNFLLQADCYDKFGNYSMASRTVMCDFKEPDITSVRYKYSENLADSGQWASGSSGSFAITAIDALSGIGKRQMRKTGTTSWGDATAESTKAESSSGEYELRVVDNAGNESELAVFDLKIDTTPPTYTISCSDSMFCTYKVKWKDERSGFSASSVTFSFNCSYSDKSFSGTVRALPSGNKGDTSRTGKFAIPTPSDARNQLRN